MDLFKPNCGKEIPISTDFKMSKHMDKKQKIRMRKLKHEAKNKKWMMRKLETNVFNKNIQLLLM